MMNPPDRFLHPPAEKQTRIAIIDIGSNSVRLVFFDLSNQVPVSYYNDKVFCGLGDALRTSGAIEGDTRTDLFKTLRRFALRIEQCGIGKCHAFATAAIREANNQKALLKSIGKILGSVGGHLHVLSGIQEAEMACAGVSIGFCQPQGIVGDLGGGSLELGSITWQSPSALPPPAETYPLGAMRLLRAFEEYGSDGFDGWLREHLSRTKILHSKCSTNFYAVGGTWRALARMYQKYTNDPLRIVHHLEIRTAQALEFCDIVIDSIGGRLPFAETVARARRGNVPMGAKLLSVLLRMGNFESVLISAFGLREGALVKLPASVNPDPTVCISAEPDLLLSLCRSICRQFHQSPEFAEGLFRWTLPLVASLNSKHTDRESLSPRILQAAAYLAEVSGLQHPEYREEHAISLALETPFAGISHPQRTQLAIIGEVRYLGSIGELTRRLAKTHLDQSQIRSSLIAGLAFRAGTHLSAGAAKVLNSSELKPGDSELCLRIGSDLEALTSSKFLSRLQSCADAAELTPRIVVFD